MEETASELVASVLNVETVELAGGGYVALFIDETTSELMEAVLNVDGVTTNGG